MTQFESHKFQIYSTCIKYFCEMCACKSAIINCYLVLVFFLQSCIYLHSVRVGENNISPMTNAGKLSHGQSLCTLSQLFCNQLVTETSWGRLPVKLNGLKKVSYN